MTTPTRPTPEVLALLSALGVGLAVVRTAGTPLQWAHGWLAVAVLSWTVAVVWPGRSRLAFVAGLVFFLTWHLDGMRVARTPIVAPGYPGWHY